MSDKDTENQSASGLTHGTESAILERITDAFIVLDSEWRYTYVNQQAAHAFDLDGPSLLGKNIWEEFPQAVGSSFHRDCLRAFAEQQPIEGEEYFPSWQRWYAHHIFPARDGLAIFSRDITDRHQAEEELRRSERRYRSLVMATAQMVWRIPVNAHFSEDHSAWEQFTGQPTATISGDGWLQAVHPEDRNRAKDIWDLARNSGKTYESQFRLRRHDGVYRDIMERAVPIRNESGEIDEWIGISIDVTEQRDAERRLQEISSLQQAILNSAEHSIITADTHSIIQTFNPAAERMLGYSAQEAIGRISPRDLHDPAEIAARRQELSQKTGQPIETTFDVFAIATQRGHPQEREWTYIRKDGSRLPVSLSVTALRDVDGNITGSVGIARDITERKALEKERERLLAEALEQADRDPLTGLYNHRVFHKRLAEEALQAQTNGTPLAVAVLDMDNFKFFNTVYGHLAGDQVLRQVSQELRETSRATDTLARFGGDEFALLLPGLERIGAEQLAETLRERMARTTFQPPGDNARVPLSLSIGVAVLPDEATTPLAALHLADERLREAKNGSQGSAREAALLCSRLSLSMKDFAMLYALVTAVDNKDRYTRQHSEEVLTCGLELADAMGLDEPERHTFGIAALLHDIGKIGVPDGILRKPGALTEEEFEAMRRHPVMGTAIVGAVPGFEDTLEAIRHHHERWDGQGYPAGLRGEEIPRLARLMAVADAYSAMTTDRPYRPALSATQARQMLEAGAGSQWDPTCVQAFLPIISSDD